MPMGSSRLGGLLLRRAPLRVEDPRAGTSGFKVSTPCVTSYNKEQCNELWLKAVWARVIARRRLVREVGSVKRRRRVPASTSTRLEPQRGQRRRSADSSNQTTFLTRDVPPKQLRQYNCLVKFENANIEDSHFNQSINQSINQSFILDNCFLNGILLETWV